MRYRVEVETRTWVKGVVIVEATNPDEAAEKAHVLLQSGAVGEWEFGRPDAEAMEVMDVEATLQATSFDSPPVSVRWAGGEGDLLVGVASTRSQLEHLLRTTDRGPGGFVFADGTPAALRAVGARQTNWGEWVLEFGDRAFPCRESPVSIERARDLLRQHLPEASLNDSGTIEPLGIAADLSSEAGLINQIDGLFMPRAITTR